MTEGEVLAWLIGILTGITLAISLYIFWLGAKERRQMKLEAEERREAQLRDLQNDVLELKMKVSSLERSQRDRDYATRL